MINTIGKLLDQAGCQFRVFEMSRIVEPISQQQFEDFENFRAPYHAPVQGHARFAIAFWSAQDKHQPFIWMLQLPLDEQSFLIAQGRDEFLALASQAINTQQQNMPENPYVFKPIAEKLAYFNARLKRDLGLAYSAYYEPTSAYFCDESLANTWQSLAMQGLADFVSQLDRDNSSEQLQSRISQLHTGLLRPLLSLLEHHPIDARLANLLLIEHQRCLDSAAEDASLWLKACASCQHSKPRQKQLAKQIDNYLDEQSAIDIAGRLWKDLEDIELLNAFLIKVAKLENPRLFRELFIDLAGIPSLRSFVLVHIRAPSNNPYLSKAVSELLSQVKTQDEH